MIKAKRFSLKCELLPLSIYDDRQYCVSEWGLVVSQVVQEELREFLEKFLSFCGRSAQGVYLRIDAFLDPSTEFLKVIEINARFVDGWGTALNLNRAAGYPVDLGHCQFPLFWHLPEDSECYRQEFNLLRRELGLAGFRIREVNRASLGKGKEVYYYGRDYPDRNNQTLVVPAWGYELDDKLKLAEFSWQWEGKLVKVPAYYSSPEWSWDEISREEIVFKFTEKYSADHCRAGASVLYARNITSRNEKFLQSCYGRRTLIAQELTAGLEINGRVSQAVILTCGTFPATGYLLLAPLSTKSINDSFEHGPLVFL